MLMRLVNFKRLMPAFVMLATPIVLADAREEGAQEPIDAMCAERAMHIGAFRTTADASGVHREAVAQVDHGTLHALQSCLTCGIGEHVRNPVAHLLHFRLAKAACGDGRRAHA